MRWLVAALLLAGCAPVRPWQRGRLASPTMQLERDANADAQRQTILEITEGGTYAGGGSGSAGGGCGCH